MAMEHQLRAFKVRPVGRLCLHSFFFFQAEDGIRDFHVTGVQTCALPISPSVTRRLITDFARQPHAGPPPASLSALTPRETEEIGRASCRERVYISVGAVSLKKKEE